MSIPFVDLKTQYRKLQPQIQQRINDVLEHGQYILGPEVFELEEKLASFTGTKYCVTAASGTEALLISLMALGVGPGDEVITTPFTFIATVEVIALLGAQPVFVDIEPDTCNSDTNKIAAALSTQTKAILPVSLYGQPANMDEINELATQHGNIPVIEDAAQSFGAAYRNRASCNLSMIGCTSFFPSKPLGCYGDGGAIFTSDAAFAQVCRELRVHGQSKRYIHERVGVGGRMDTIQCAVVLAKLDNFAWELNKREQIGKRYNQLFDSAGIARVEQRPDRTSVFAQYTVFVDDRDYCQAVLRDAGIPSAIHYPMPANAQPAYQQYQQAVGTPCSQEAAQHVLSLPMSPYLESFQQEIVASTLIKAICERGTGVS